MPYLYHRVPKNMQGNVLYPLNVLKEIYPEVYEKNVEKYVGREWTLDLRIPPLDCLWNDALHFSPVHPEELRAVTTVSGEFFQIPVTALDSAQATIYLYPGTDGKTGFDERSFIPYDPKKIGEYVHLPEETKRYYERMAREGKRPLLFHLVPHILYKGSLDIGAFPAV